MTSNARRDVMDKLKGVVYMRGNTEASAFQEGTAEAGRLEVLLTW